MMTERTFDCEKELPSLPIPDLEHSCKLYLDSVKAMLETTPFEVIDDDKRRERERRLAKTCSLVDDFVKGEGRQLHNIFLKMASGQRNWLEPYWLKAYLAMRESSALLINYGGAIKFYPRITCDDVADENDVLPWNGTVFTFLLLDFYKLMRSGNTIMPERSARKELLSMNQYRFLFNACRRPGIGRDECVTHFKTVDEAPSVPSHIIVLCNGRIFCVEPLELAPVQIFELFSRVKQIAYTGKRGPGLSALTYANRDEWARMRDWLIAKSSRNAANLTKIEEAIFAITLDPFQPPDKSAATWRALYGDPENRWADKPGNYVFYGNGFCSSYCEHTNCDGFVHAASGYYMDNRLDQFFGGVKGLMEMEPVTGENGKKLEPAIEELVFDGVDNGNVKSAISKVLAEVELFASDIDILFTQIDVAGNSFFDKYGLSLDVTCQLVMQLAYMRCHPEGQCAAVYKTASCRRYFHGRTETVRSCNKSAVQFCRAMLAPTNVSSSPQERWRLFKEAHSDHLKLSSSCSRGRGADRHLMMLKAIAGEMVKGKLPELFTDPSWKMTGGDASFALSSSYGGRFGDVGCCAPMRRGGYGVFYASRDDFIYFLLSAYRSDRPATNVQRYFQNIELAFCQVKALIEDFAPVISDGDRNKLPIARL